MCEWGTSLPIYVIRRNNDSIPDGWHLIYVDACIAPVVQTMNNLGILTVGCCCGHGKTNATVLVELESEELMLKFGYNYTVFEDRLLEYTFFAPK